ncbi:MAG: hydroxyacid dehydrogenase [Clostridia bacterium]
MAYKVLIPQDIPQDSKKILIDLGYEVKMGKGITIEDIKADVVECDAIVARTAPLTKEIMESGKKLKVISRYGVGVDNIDLKAAEELGIWVTNAPVSNCTTVAEHTVIMMTACAIDLIKAHNDTRNGNYTACRNQLMGMDLEGKVLGIIGIGKIGAHVAKIAMHGFGMKVLAYDPYVSPDKVMEGIEILKDWDRIFQTSDFISMHLPLSPATERIVGQKEFGMMKATAYFINCARGGIVDEKALIEALETKEIAGAALDVFSDEPPKEDNPLFKMEQVIVTPHTASFTKEAYDRMGEHMAKGIHEVFSGKKPTWPVNNPKL